MYAQKQTQNSVDTHDEQNDDKGVRDRKERAADRVDNLPDLLESEEVRGKIGSHQIRSREQITLGQVIRQFQRIDHIRLDQENRSDQIR